MAKPLTPFVQAYLECALWSSKDDNAEPLDDNYDLSDLSDEVIASAIEDCEDFQEANVADLDATGVSYEENGHDFWLTRNRHGAGYWDRGYGEVGQRLADAARVYGSVNLYVGDDGLIYGS